MNPETDLTSFDSVKVEQPGRHVRQQVRLDAVGITVDRYGRAHDASTGHFMDGRILSQENVQSLARWQDYIVENAPDKQQKAMRAEAPVARPNARVIPQIREVADTEPARLGQRIKRKFSRTRAELYLLPHTALQIAANGLGRAINKADSARRGAETSRRKKVVAWLITSGVTGVAIARTAGSAYASTKYGFGGGSFESHGQFGDVVSQHLGGVAVHGSNGGGSGTKQSVMANVLQHGNNVPTSAKHEASSGLVYDPITTPGKHAQSQLAYDPATHTTHNETVTQLSSAGKHKQSQLTYDPFKHRTPGNPQGPGHHQHAVFLSRDFVEHGNGITQEYVDVAGQHGINLSGEEAYSAYNYVNAHIHGNFFMDDPMYRLPNGDLGISHPGWAHWTREEQFWFRHWMVTNGKVSAKAA